MSGPTNTNDAAGDPPRLHGEDEAGPASNRRDIAGLLIAVALFALAALIYSDASKYPIRRSYAQFGPEIVPYIVAGGIIILAVLTVIMALRGGFEVRERLNIPGIAWLAGAIIVQIGMLYAGAGFILASTVLFTFAARAFGQKTMLLNAGIGAIMSTLLFLLFRYGLGLALPAGPLENAINLLLR